MKKFPNHLLWSSSLIIALSSSTQAAVYSLSGTISSSQEVPTNSSTGNGTIMGSYDDATNILSWTISFSGLTGPATGMHFHGPAMAGVNAGVQVNIGTISGLTSPSSGMTGISDAQGSDLVNGLWYVNIHTANFGGGEIRGQVIPTVVPEPSSVAFLGLAAFALVFRRK